MASLYVPFVPWLARHRTDVSASQSVASQPVPPPRDFIVIAASPMSAPRTVMYKDPVPGWFDSVLLVLFANLKPVTPISTDHAPLKLLYVSPNVNTARRVPRTPWLTLHCTDVSDFHPDDSQPVSPALACNVSIVAPSPIPCIVTDADPVPARFPELT